VEGGPPIESRWQGTYHESEFGIPPADPVDTYPVSNLRGSLGLSRHRCYLATDTSDVNDIDCAHNGGTNGTGYDLTYLNATGSGWDHTDQTTEGTKIIPDGMLTPGSCVQYFFRRAEGGTSTMTGMVPDTNVIYPQSSERSNDAHRWQEFSILPDRWKDAGYT